MFKLTPNQRNALRTNVAEHFGLEELKTLCFDLGVKFDNLAGESLDAKVAALILWFEERDRTSDLIEKLRQERPKADWSLKPRLSPNDLSNEPLRETEQSPVDRGPNSMPQPAAGGADPAKPLIEPKNGKPGCQVKMEVVIALTVAFIGLIGVLGEPFAAKLAERWLPSGTPVAGMTPTVSPTSSVTSSPTATFTATPSHTWTPMQTPPHTSIPTPSPTSTSSPIPTPTLPHTSTPTPSRTPTPRVVETAVVALRTWSGRYVTDMDITPNRRLKAQDTPIGDRQKFILLCLANDKAALQIADRFVSALNDEPGRNWELRVEVVERLAWEEFALVDPDTRDPLHCVEVLKQLRQGEVRLAFQTFHGRFVTALGQDYDWVLRAETTALDRYEKFTVINLALTPIVTPTPTRSPTPTSTPCASCAGCVSGRGYGCPENMATVVSGMSDLSCTDIFTLTSPITATQIRIEMTKRAMEEFGYSLYEVEAYGPDDPTKNLLKGGAVSVSSTEDDRYIATNATDGGKITRWAGEKGRDPQWLEITLPQPVRLNRIELKWEQAYAREYCVIVKPAQ